MINFEKAKRIKCLITLEIELPTDWSTECSDAYLKRMGRDDLEKVLRDGMWRWMYKVKGKPEFKIRTVRGNFVR